MKRAARGSLAAGAIALACWVVGCGWEEIDAFVRSSGGNGDDASTGSPDAEFDAGTAPDVTTGNPTDGAFEPTDGTDEGETGLTIGDGNAVSSLPCTSSAPLRTWTFDTDSEGWTFLPSSGVSGGLTWTGATGNPSPGALDVSVTSSLDASTPSGGWAEFQATPLGNLSGRTLSAWVWLESGMTPNLKFFVQTGSQFVWADNGTVHLQAHVWTCVSFSVSNPAYTNGPGYDPQNVVRLGFEMLALQPFRVYVDTVSYQ